VNTESEAKRTKPGRAREDGGHREQQPEAQRITAAHIHHRDVLGGEADERRLERRWRWRPSQQRHHERDGGANGAAEVGLQRLMVGQPAEFMPWTDQPSLRQAAQNRVKSCMPPGLISLIT